jgi:hypothetical protein
MQKRQHVVTGGFHHGYGAGELLAQHLGDLLPMGSDLLRLLDHEHRFHGRRHHVLTSLRHVAEQVAQEVHPAALPGATLEHALDRCRQAQVGIGDHQPGANQATLFE